MRKLRSFLNLNLSEWQPSLAAWKIKLSFVPEHTADPESAETFLRNRGILKANLPVCDTCGQEMSEVKIGRGDAAVWRCPKHQEENFHQKRVENHSHINLQNQVI